MLFHCLQSPFLFTNTLLDPMTSIEDISPEYSGTSIDFISLATTNFDSWNTKVVQLTGEITALDKNGFTLNNKLFCQFKHEDDSFRCKSKSDNNHKRSCYRIR